MDGISGHNMADGTTHERLENDAYYSEPELTDALVDRLVTDGWISDLITETVLEPSLGKGAFAVSVRRAINPRVLWGVDIDKLHTAQKTVDLFIEEDFLVWAKRKHERGFDLVIGNPPFGLKVEGKTRPDPVAEKHVRAALGLRSPSGVAAFLLRSAFAESSERIPFWKEHPPSKVFALAERPSYTGDGKTDKGQSYSFFVWKRGHRGVSEYENLSWKRPPPTTSD